MQYKTIILEILKQHPKIYHHLLNKRMVLQTLERHARDLKTNHERWMDLLRQARQGGNQDQIRSEALEMALWELEICLKLEFPQEESESLTLDEAMTFIRNSESTV